MRSVWIKSFTFGPALATLISTSGFAFPQTPESSTTDTATSEPIVPERRLGAADAAITIDLYQSFLCADCAAWQRTVLPELRSRYLDTGAVRLVFHDAPSEPYETSVRAAMVGLCAAPDHFFDVADSLFAGIPALQAGGLISDWLNKAMLVAGRPQAEVSACAESEETYNMVRLQNAQAQMADISSLPAIKINGVLLPEPTLEAIEAAITPAAEPAPSGDPAD